MKICDYGCGQKAEYQFKNGKWCCCKSFNSCPAKREKHSTYMKDVRKDLNSKYNSIEYKDNQSKRMKEEWRNSDSIFNSVLCKEKQSKGMLEAWKNPNSGLNSISRKEKIIIANIKAWNDPNSIFNLISYRIKRNKSHQLTIDKINKRYPFFSKIEEMRYNPNKPSEKEIQVHCKNHECENSREKGGWFTPKYEQLRSRCNALDREEGNDGNYFYCSQHCKDTCFLYNLHGDPYRDNNKPYTPAELGVFNKHILKRDNEICYYCGEHHATIVHHLRPQKLEPFFALDPDYAISVCMKCHYKYGHPTGSKHSTGNLAKIICSTESQKFLNQKII
jgi:hypothetical protein